MFDPEEADLFSPLRQDPAGSFQVVISREQKLTTGQANQPHQIRADEGHSPMSYVCFLRELGKGLESIIINKEKLIQRRFVGMV